MKTVSTFAIDPIKFRAAIDNIVKERHFKNWAEICRDLSLCDSHLADCRRRGKISNKTAKLLEKAYGLKTEDYTPVIEGIFEEQEEAADLADQIARGIKIALDDVQNRNTLRGIIASGIVAALEAQKGARE